MSWFTIAIFQPLFNGLLFLQKVLPAHDLGLAIILLTLVIKAILYVPSLSGIRASRQLQVLQPQLKALQAKYKDNREQLAQEQMKLYKESKVNPFSSCLPLLIQIPIFIGLYQVFISGLKIDANGILVTSELHKVYPALRAYFDHTSINTMFLGFINLAHNHNVILALLAGLSQFWQTKMLAAPKEPKIEGAKDESLTSATNRQMMYLLPLFTIYIAYTFPAGLALYWIVQSVLTIAQQYIFLRQHPITVGDITKVASGGNGQPA